MVLVAIHVNPLNPIDNPLVTAGEDEHEDASVLGAFAPQLVESIAAAAM